MIGRWYEPMLLGRAVEMTDIYTELVQLVREQYGRPRRDFRQLPGEAILRAITENA